MIDQIYDAGCQAYLDDKGENDCPYRDEYVRSDGNHYWNSQAGKRQRWMCGFRITATRNELMSRCGRIQAPQWSGEW